MKKKNLIRFARSIIFVPVMTMPILFGGVQNGEISQNVLAQKQNIDPVRSRSPQGDRSTFVFERAASNGIEALQEAKARAIDAYFEARSMPLAGTGMKMVIESENHNIDWRLLPAIAVRESTGGKNACNKVKNNPFGWGSCKIGFKSIEKAIETVAKNLGGNNPSTEYHYSGKTTKEILRKYNPPSVVPRYAEQVMAIMNVIGAEDITQDVPMSSSDLLTQKA